MTHFQQTLFEPTDWTAGIDVGGGPAAPLTLADARPYQLGWRDAVLGVWARTADPALGVAATATGKSLGVGLLARAVLDGALDAFGRERRFLFVAHRAVLVEQAAAGLADLLPDKTVDVEMGDRRAAYQADVVVACIDSLCIPRRLRFFPADRWSAVCWDECHRFGLTTKKVRTLLDHFAPPTRHLGITATPDRPDGRIAFREVAFEYDIGRAVADGWLVPPHMVYETGTDFRLETVGTRGGDFDADELSDRMQQGSSIAAVVEAARKWSNFKNGRGEKRATMIPCASVPQARRVAAALNEWHDREGSGKAVAVWCDMPEGRADSMRAFGSGEAQYITYFDLLTEGYDSDRPKVLVNGRPTKSRWVLGQNAGRCLRPARECRAALAAAPDAAARRSIIRSSVKPGSVIIDVSGTSHGLSCDMVTVFKGTGDTDAVLARARAAVKYRADKGLPADVQAELAAARAAVRAEKEAAEAARWKGVLVSSTLHTTRVDPYRPAPAGGREPPWLRGKRATLPMKLALIRAGLPRPEVEGYTFSQAKRMLDVVAERRKNGLCSYKQCRALMARGIDAGSLTFEEASAELDRLFGRPRPAAAPTTAEDAA